MAVTLLRCSPIHSNRRRYRAGRSTGVPKRSCSDQAGRRNVKRSSQCGVVAFKHAGDPNVGEFSDAVVLKKFGDVPNDLS